jgi:hypothetical protein
MIFHDFHRKMIRGEGDNHARKNINWILAIKGLG